MATYVAYIFSACLQGSVGVLPAAARVANSQLDSSDTVVLLGVSKPAVWTDGLQSQDGICIDFVSLTFVMD